MPYYRIVIWTKRQKAPLSGIRQYASTHIDNIHKQAVYKAQELYGRELIKVEVQMLSKLAEAVKLIGSW